MMDIYAYPAKDTYLMNWRDHFTMPTDSGGTRVLAMRNTKTHLIVAIWTIYSTFTFMLGWESVRVLVIAFTGEIHGGWFGGVFNLWKVGSLNIAMAMLKYIYEMIFYLRKTPEEKRRRGNVPKWPVYEDRCSGRQVTQDQSGESGLDSDGIDQREGSNRGHHAEVQRLSLERRETTDREISGTEATDTHIPNNEIPGVKDLILSLLLFLVSFSLYLTDFALGVIVGAKLIVGNVAPANPDKVFYPDINTLERQGDTTGLLRVKSMKIDSAFRAMAAIEGPDPQARRKRVVIESVDPPEGLTAGFISNLNYSYNVTGADMGLQSDPKLMLRVKGGCRSEYTWLVNTTEEGDTYRLWGGNETYHIKPDAQPTTPPWLAFFHDEKQILDRSPNLSYAIIANTAGRYSYTASQDPWYSTRETRTNGTPPYQVLPNRPVLSCWETKTWHLGGKDVDNWRLNELPDLKLHKLWSDTVFPLEFELPRVVSLGRVLGISSLRTGSHSLEPFYVIDAGSASMHGDFKRLVLGSWISSRNVLRDTTTYNHGNMVNLAHGEGDSVDASAAGFVIQSQDVSTLSVRILYSVLYNLISNGAALVLLRALTRRNPVGLVAYLKPRMARAGWGRKRSR
ncbi:unnamed protein product [Tuber aestivum]|uniref:Uncharacterized protein n=1 Tax=Tuber aestivum TaxID=59557 RepID=A0A292Q1Y0_9PEZI|nr:unnamed protein product [Tuber aestivum]